MYTPDIIQLRSFYSTAFGESVRLLIDGAIKKIWPEVSSDSIVAIGYATPYLHSYLGEKNTIVACMPAQQGAVYWPHGGDNLTLIAHDSELPFAENSVNRVLLVHSMENSEQLSWLTSEIWRILIPGGRILAVAANRRSMWSASPRSPFGYGRPFSMSQIKNLLEDQQFTIMRSSSALFMPPTHIKFFWKAAARIEKFGYALFRIFGACLGGILLVEAEKQIFSAVEQPVVEAKKYRTSVLGPRPAMSMEKTIK